MLFAMLSAILCALFTLAIPVGLMRDPIRGIMSYPPAIRRRVESLPQYRDTIQRTERKHLMKKGVAAAILVAVLAMILWFAGRRTFGEAFWYAWGLFTVVNLWDLLVLDWLWFCHSRRVRLPGTEDMTEAYRDYGFHAIGFLKGTAIGLIVSLLAASIVALM